jgi:hypothetical protein
VLFGQPKRAWDGFWKDLRGDNMGMQNDFSGAAGLTEHAAPKEQGQ